MTEEERDERRMKKSEKFLKARLMTEESFQGDITEKKYRRMG